MMGFPFGWTGTKAESCCPNCGAKGWDDQLKRKQPECESCGYKKVETKQGTEMTLVFCQGCGCHYTNGCSLHPLSQQKKV